MGIDLSEKCDYTSSIFCVSRSAPEPAAQIMTRKSRIIWQILRGSKLKVEFENRRYLFTDDVTMIKIHCTKSTRRYQTFIFIFIFYFFTLQRRVIFCASDISKSGLSFIGSSLRIDEKFSSIGSRFLCAVAFFRKFLREKMILQNCIRLGIRYITVYECIWRIPGCSTRLWPSIYIFFFIQVCYGWQRKNDLQQFSDFFENFSGSNCRNRREIWAVVDSFGLTP